jgi:hypothetical protein
LHHDWPCRRRQDIVSRIPHGAQADAAQRGADERARQVVAWLEAEDELASELERRLRAAAEALDALRSQVECASMRECVR